MEEAKDSILLLNIYKRYLQTTADLVTILERNYNKKQKLNGDSGNKKVKEKYEEFETHAREVIKNFHDDLHELISLDYDLKRLEEQGENNE